MKINDVIKADRFYFLRHGESVNNKKDLVNGWTDCPLTERGRTQARRAAMILKNHPINRIVTSDLQRAVETAEIVADIVGLPVETYPGLRERNWGVYENTEKKYRPSLDIFPKNGETWAMLFKRVGNTISACKIVNNNLIVGHAGIWRFIYSYYSSEKCLNVLPNATPYIISVMNNKGQQMWNYKKL